METEEERFGALKGGFGLDRVIRSCVDEAARVGETTNAPEVEMVVAFDDATVVMLELQLVIPLCHEQLSLISTRLFRVGDVSIWFVVTLSWNGLLRCSATAFDSAGIGC